MLGRKESLVKYISLQNLDIFLLAKKMFNLSNVVIVLYGQENSVFVRLWQCNITTLGPTGSIISYRKNEEKNVSCTIATCMTCSAEILHENQFCIQ